jgi:hypothetical protein
MRVLLPLIAVGVALAALGGCHRADDEGSGAAARSTAAEIKPAAADDDAGDGVTLKPAEVKTMGIEVIAARPATHVPETSGFGVVSPHEAVAQALSELETTEATQRQSRAALARAQGLASTPGALPADSTESAERQAAIDAAAARLARRRLTASFGQSAPWGDRVDSPLLRSLASGEAKLVRVTFPLGALGPGEMPQALRLAHLDDLEGGKSWRAAPVWPAPADASVPGTSFFALLTGTTAREGERLVAWVARGAPEAGVLVPQSAVVISDNQYWCYVERKPGVFVRTELDTSVPLDGSYFVKTGIAPGDEVVTAAAGQLLARETNPGSGAAD